MSFKLTTQPQMDTTENNKKIVTICRVRSSKSKELTIISEDDQVSS